MSVKFLGQFFIQQGAITAEQLREALELMDRTNPKLGDLALRAGYLTAEQIEDLDQEQRLTGESFLGILSDGDRLSAVQLDDLLSAQLRGPLELGEALVRLGHLSRADLGRLLELFHQDQAPYQIEPGASQPVLGEHRPAQTVVELLPRLCSSMFGLQMAVLQATECPPNDVLVYRSSVVMRGSFPLRVELACSQSLALAIARGLSDDPELPADARVLNASLGEFLNVVAGNALALLESKGIHLSLLPPEQRGVRRRGAALEVVTPSGNGVLFLDTAPDIPRPSLEIPPDEE